MIEILVVLTILLILMSIAYVALGRSGEKARVAATQTTIAQLNTVLQADFQALLQDFAEQERTRARKAEWDNLLAGRSLVQAAYTSVTNQQADALVRQNRYLGLFPQRWQDMFGFNGTENLEVAASPYGMVNVFGPTGPLVPEDAWHSRSPVQKRIVAAASKLNPPLNAGQIRAAMTTGTVVNQNAELLYLLLTGSPNGSQLISQVNPRHIGDTDADGLPEFLDDWGQPLRFYNTPTYLFASNANAAELSRTQAVRIAFFPNVNANTGTRDPLDPVNALNGSAFDDAATLPDPQLLQQPTEGIIYHHLGVYYAPLIVSSGPDETLGLTEPDSSVSQNRTSLLAVLLAGSDEALDNITNYQGAN